MVKKTILFLGCGNLVESLCVGARPYLQKAFEGLYFYTPSGVKAKKLAELFPENGYFVDSWKELKPDVVVLGFKPQNLSFFSYSLEHDHIIVSLLACADQKNLELWSKKPVIRVMTNTAMEVNEAVSLFYFGENQEKETVSFVNDLFSQVGINKILEKEEELDYLTPFTASSLALYFYFQEILEEKILKETSLEQKEIHTLMAQALQGSVSLMKKSKDLAREREKVTSKGGLTFELIKSIGDDGAHKILGKAFDKAKEKYHDLKKSLF
jgi:pyrroline-5-carboxylate reductase